jgi:pimeloyl-ACP methyl ester carboxylesterase
MIETDLYHEYHEKDPPTVVFVHGSMDRGASFKKAVNYLGHYSTLIYDRRGYGKSRGLDPAVSDGVAGNVKDLKQLTNNLGDFILVGHSFGGVIALTFAQDAPVNLKALLVYEPPLSFMPWWHDSDAPTMFSETGTPEMRVDIFMTRMLKERWINASDRAKAKRFSEAPALVADLSRLRYEPPPFDPANIQLPVLLARGSESHARHHRAASWLLKGLVNAKEVVVAGAGHTLHSSDPQKFAGLIIELLSSL